MRELLLWIYCMDYSHAILLILLATFLFLALFHRFGHRRFWKPAIVCLLLCWAAAVVSQTILFRSPLPNIQLILRPFQSYTDMIQQNNREILRSNFMNVLLFYPAGLLIHSILPSKWNWIIRIGIVFFLSSAASICIEYFQYTRLLGLVQTDDVIHNVLGGVIGACSLNLSKLYIAVYEKIKRK